MSGWITVTVEELLKMSDFRRRHVLRHMPESQLTHTRQMIDQYIAINNRRMDDAAKA